MVLDGILTVVDSKHIVGQLQEDRLGCAVSCARAGCNLTFAGESGQAGRSSK